MLFRSANEPDLYEVDPVVKENITFVTAKEIGTVLEKALARNHVTHIYHVYDDAPHAVAAGKGTDADGWLNEAAAFWEEQVG